MYFERTTAPLKTDPNVIPVPNGNNHALKLPNGLCLPNCTGYVHFRALEAVGKECEKRLCLNNAVAYYNYKDGYERGYAPNIGIMVWSGGQKGYGHVAWCEKPPDANGDVIASASNYGKKGDGTWFYRSKFTKASGYKLYSSKSNYTYLGCIYLPVVWTYGRNTGADQLRIKIDNLNMRTAPSVNADRLGYCLEGAIYNIQDKAVAGSYTWYKIDNDQWIAYDPAWAEVLPKKSVKSYSVTFPEVSNGDKLMLQDIATKYQLSIKIEENK